MRIESKDEEDLDENNKIQYLFGGTNVVLTPTEIDKLIENLKVAKTTLINMKGYVKE